MLRLFHSKRNFIGSTLAFELIQDFSNQVFYWADYRRACAKQGKKPAKFVSCHAAEFMAGRNLN